MLIKKTFRNLSIFIFGILHFLGFVNFLHAQERNSENVVSARGPVWTEELGDVPLDKYTREELSAMIRNYWTPERMKNAVPADTLISKDVAERGAWKGDDSVEVTPKVVLSKPVASKSVKKYGNNKNFPNIPMNQGTANGKIFYRIAGTNIDKWCSGSAVNSSSRRLVATAAHCVHGGGPEGTWHQNWYFVPNSFLDVWEPYGNFAVFVFWAMPGWVNYGASPAGFNSDVAFVTTEVNLFGDRVVDAVGGHGLTYGGGYIYDATLFGYPENIEYGLIMQGCSGTTYKRVAEWYNYVSISGCNFHKGASGGPWLESYDHYMGLGFLRGVSSWAYEGNTEHINSPRFTNAVFNLFSSANSADW